jgi:hypothetical protein
MLDARRLMFDQLENNQKQGRVVRAGVTAWGFLMIFSVLLYVF